LKNNILYKIIFLFLIFQNTSIADEREKILSELIKTKSLKFNFEQKTNEKKEQGLCYLNFPGLLRCEYKDSKQKELIINKSRLAITQKRYDKTLFYSIKKSPFIKILNKKYLIQLISTSELKFEDNLIQLTSSNDKERITILFNKSDFNLVGWEILDQFQNKIIFLIDILSINESFDLSMFEIPS
tara:strand:- start:422 stop:976 length:555 start_codon:yes stop_codon:yes gene_type:complete